MTFNRERATSFGSVAESYDRVRPGPAAEALDWLVPHGCGVAVDLAAGTGLVHPRADRPGGAGGGRGAGRADAGGARAALAGGATCARAGARPCRCRTAARTPCSSRPRGTGSTRRGRSPRSPGCCGRAAGSASSGRAGTGPRTGWPSSTCSGSRASTPPRRRRAAHAGRRAARLDRHHTVTLPDGAEFGAAEKRVVPVHAGRCRSTTCSSGWRRTATFITASAADRAAGLGRLPAAVPEQTGRRLAGASRCRCDPGAGGRDARGAAGHGSP